MQLGLNIGYAGADMRTTLPLVQRAEALGIDSVWAAESYGPDVFTVLSYLAARTHRIKLATGIAQMPARTPANMAMTAMTLDALSGGRLVLGLGVSGPQVVEGWHGVAYGKPLVVTREYIDIVRSIVAREQRLIHDGERFQIPYAGDDATGLGRPLKSILHPVRSRIPIYLAAIGPRNVALAAEIADGWLPMFYAPEREDAFGEQVAEGVAAGGRSAGDLDVIVAVFTAVGDDLQACRDQVRPRLALYIGGMGARGQNFYHRLATRYGFGEAADRIQDHYLAGRKDEAAAAVPDALVDEVALVGPLERVRDRLEAWRESRVGTVALRTTDPEVLAGIIEGI